VIQLTILNGKAAGQACVARRFPFQMGRSSPAHLVVEGDGIWEGHATIHFRAGEGFFLETKAGALVCVNGERTEHSRLRNGDLIELGSVKLRFWLAPLRQQSFQARETLTWFALAVLFAFQLGIIYWVVG
jgi:hypothetical protein